MKRRSFLISAPAAGAAAYATLGASGCGTTAATVLVGLLDAANVAITVLSTAGVIPPGDTAWVMAASKFITDAVNESLTSDPIATKITNILGFYTQDFKNVPLPGNTNIYITAAILAIDALVAFLNAQKAAVAVAAAIQVPAGLVQISGTMSGAEKSEMKRILSQQKDFAAKIK